MEGVRYLADAMSDPDHPDYDPQGELCVMKYMESDLSGVLVKGHKSMVVGLGSSGVTAGEGSNFVILCLTRGVTPAAWIPLAQITRCSFFCPYARIDLPGYSAVTKVSCDFLYWFIGFRRFLYDSHVDSCVCFTYFC